MRDRGQNFGLIWVDAHGDMNTPSSTESGNVHGMPLAAILGPEPAELSRLGGFSPKIDPDHVVLIGVRNLDDREKQRVRESRIHVFTMKDIDRSGIAAVIEQAIAIAGRDATDTGYRMAVIGGKGIPFTRPTAWSSPQDFGTDGGAHNFLRYLEDWQGDALNYRGSIVSFFTSRQAVGIYKCCVTVYGAPTRGYNFDTDFLVPSLLPPGTPMFRDVNTLTFRQLLRPTQ